MPDRNSELSRSDWVSAAMTALCQGGIEAVRVEVLARDLKVSKGSFYWHFRNRRDLLDAMLDLWRDELTSALIVRTQDHRDPLQRLEALAEAALEPFEGAVDVAQAEGALRAWAAVDDLARQRVREVDELRLQHVAAELSALGVDADTARQGAKAIYLALLGLYTARRYTPEIADDEAFRYVVRKVLGDTKARTRRLPSGGPSARIGKRADEDRP